MSHARGDQFLPGDLTVRRFKLTQALTAFGAADAICWAFDKMTNAYMEKTPNFRMYDVTGRTGSVGDIGYAVLMADSQRWEIWDLQC